MCPHFVLLHNNLCHSNIPKKSLRPSLFQPLWIRLLRFLRFFRLLLHRGEPTNPYAWHKLMLWMIMGRLNGCLDASKTVVGFGKAFE